MNRISGTMEQLMPMLKEQLDSGATVRLQITGTSMLPLLRNGKDSVLLRTACPPKKGDIILYQRKNGRYVLHRIVGFSGENFLCCGDNQWRKETVRPEQVQAAVCGYFRESKEYGVHRFLYQRYVNHLILRRFFCRLRDAIFH